VGAVICQDCRAAGRLLAASAVDADYLADMHAQCPGGTRCDCQHVTVSALGPWVLQPVGESQQIGPLLDVPDMGALT